jgi:uronate dehydrogenase
VAAEGQVLSRYGVSKAFGEALGALYAFKCGLRVLCIRIGNVANAPVDKRRIWIKPEDLVQLVRIGLEHPDLRHEIFYGALDNDRSWWDNEAAFRYGYRRRAAAKITATLCSRPRPSCPPTRSAIGTRAVLQRRIRGETPL